MDIIWTIFIGFFAGLVARAVMPGDDSMGFFLTALLGIVGSVVVTFIGQFSGWYHAAEGAGFVASVVGAVGLLGIAGLIRARSKTPQS